MNALLVIALLVALGYGMLAGIIYFKEPQLLYFPDVPTRTLMATPARPGLDFSVGYPAKHRGRRQSV